MRSTPPRPTSLPPVDCKHEFFARWLEVRDPVVGRWLLHFEEHQVPIRIRVLDEKVMIYAHKIWKKTNDDVTAKEWWCCEDGR